jgi:HemY protein
MRRLLICFGLAAGIAALAAWLAGNPGSLVVNWRGYRFESSFVMLLALMAALYFLIRLPLWIYGRLRGATAGAGRRNRALSALTSGMTAIAAGDAREATRQAARAERLMGPAPLSLLMRAQAAQLGQDEPAAREYFQAMLASPDSAFLGLRGLLGQAMRAGDLAQARTLAEEGLRLQPKSPWLIRNKFDIECAAGEWLAAQETLSLAVQAKLLGKAEQSRKLGLLAFAEAREAEARGAHEPALAAAGRALKQAPDLIPAACLLGRLLGKAGKTAKAERVLEKAWARAPHPDLAAVFANLVPGERPSQQLLRIRRLTAANPGHKESRLLLAEASLAAGESARARELLQPLTQGAACARVCRLMARISEAQGAPAREAQEWLARARQAPRDAAWHCQACGRPTEDWALHCPACGEFDTLQWGETIPRVTAGAGLLAQGAPL